MKRILVLTVRALALRCPHCGSGGLFASWFRMKARCPGCGLPLQRGEDEDHFLGGMMFNIVLAELVFAAGMVFWLVATWPDPPWDLVQTVGVVFMAIAPVVFYPLSRTVWLAFDLMFRPATSAELGHEQAIDRPHGSHDACPS